jgi:hypothetical protein
MAEQPEATNQREIRTLSCRLTQQEFAVRATEFAQLDRKLDELEAAKKAAVEGFKDKIGGVNDRRAVLRDTVITRAEDREVQCTWFADWASKSMLLRRDDTNEVVEARTMTPEEVQSHFDFTEDKSRHLPDQTDDSEPLDA